MGGSQIDNDIIVITYNESHALEVGRFSASWCYLIAKVVTELVPLNSSKMVEQGWIWNVLLVALPLCLCDIGSFVPFLNCNKVPLCAYDSPNVTVTLNRSSNSSVCVPDSVLCGWQCKGDSRCLRYNYRSQSINANCSSETQTALQLFRAAFIIRWRFIWIRGSLIYNYHSVLEKITSNVTFSWFWQNYSF